MKEYLLKAQHRKDLSSEEAKDAMLCILDSATDLEIYDFLIAMNKKDVSVDELVGFSRGMKERAIAIRPDVKTLIDTCGTGGDCSGTLNVSTGAAIIISAAGIPVAKHGNYSVSSKCGSANLLEAIGYDLEMTPKLCEQMIEDIGFGFLFAPRFHPAMKKVAPIRKQIGQKTIFNLLGPLCNPAGADVQLIGVYSEDLCEKFCYALDRLGSKHAFVVHGCGLDEISNVAETLIYELREGSVSSYILCPEDLGFTRYSLEDISGSSPQDNAECLKKILQGERGAKRDILTLNAGSGIYLGGGAKSLEQGIRKAQEALDSGAASAKLQEIVDYSNR